MRCINISQWGDCWAQWPQIYQGFNVFVKGKGKRNPLVWNRSNVLQHWQDKCVSLFARLKGTLFVLHMWQEVNLTAACICFITERKGNIANESLLLPSLLPWDSLITCHTAIYLMIHALNVWSRFRFEVGHKDLALILKRLHPEEWNEQDHSLHGTMGKSSIHNNSIQQLPQWPRMGFVYRYLLCACFSLLF